jgi:hypothetical protein
MKVLLISANRERDPYPVFPIGLAPAMTWRSWISA